MSIDLKISQIKDRYHNDDFMLLYGETVSSAERYIGACEKFSELFNSDGDVFLFSAPGRTEVGGNHTDHQHGNVLAGSVNLDVIAVVSKNNDGIVRIKSEGYNMDEVNLSDLNIKKEEEGKAISLIRGMLGIMAENGYKIGGFNAYTTSNVLKGSGLSSSAAFEVLIGNIISGLFNDGSVSPVDIAIFAQKAENVYFGKPCGLMDQTASSVGGFTAIDFNDVKNPIIRKITYNIDDAGYALCIVNTGGDHADLTGDYADITVGDRKVAEYFGKEYLREVDENDFFDNIKELRNVVDDKAILSSLHFFADNKRAVEEAECLEKGEFGEFLNLINDSGNSSFKYLQNVFSLRQPYEQGLSVALALTEKFLEGNGACRVHGGGFAGTIQVFVQKQKVNQYKEYIEKVFGKNSCYILNIRPVGGYALKK